MPSQKRKSQEDEKEQPEGITTPIITSATTTTTSVDANEASDAVALQLKPPPPTQNNDDANDDDDDDSSEDDDLILEGVMVRNHDVSDEDDSDDDDDDEEEEKVDNDDDDDILDDRKSNTKRVSAITTKEQSQTTPQLQVPNSSKKKQKKKKTRSKTEEDDEDDILNVDFTFCDMDEKYFHGIKSLLQSCGSIYQLHSSALTDLMIDNVAIGTVVSTTMEDVNEPDVFGLASILNIKTYQHHTVIQQIQQFCMTHCPSNTTTVSPAQQQELQYCWSGTTKRPVGLLLQARMINMPMEIVLVLHEQLIQDMDWAIDQYANLDETEEERKAHDFGAFIRLAPAERDTTSTSYSHRGGCNSNNGILFKYFDDELFMERSEFHYVVDVVTAVTTKSKTSSHQQPCLVVMVLTKTGHRAAIQDLKQLIHGR